MRAFIESETTGGFRDLAVDMHLNFFVSVARQTGGVDFVAYRLAEGRAEVITRDRHFGDWQTFGLELDPAGDDKIVGISLSSGAPQGLERRPIDDATLVARARARLTKACELELFSGAALLAKGDDVLVLDACGEASKRFRAPNKADTKFNLGSMNKMFTATAIAQLAEGGRLSYDDPISRWVDDTWLPADITAKVTVAHLLSHRSGLGSYFNETFWTSSRENFRGLADFKPLVNGETLAFEPGERFQYSNTGMLLLGVVIEGASGQGYFDYVRDHIFEPAGMANTDSFEMDVPVENLAIGYSRDSTSPTGWRNNLYKHVIKGGPAGGGFSTVEDLHRFARALLGGTLVSDQSRDTLWTLQGDGERGYGYGFQIDRSAGPTQVGHSGGFPGLNGQLVILPESGYVIAVLANYDRAASPVAASFVELALATLVGER